MPLPAQTQTSPSCSTDVIAGTEIPGRKWHEGILTHAPVPSYSHPW